MPKDPYKSRTAAMFCKKFINVKPKLAVTLFNTLPAKANELKDST